MVACLNGDWAWKGHCQWEEKSLANNINMNIRTFEIVSNPQQRKIHLYLSGWLLMCTRQKIWLNATLRLKVIRKFDKLGANNKSFPEFCVNSVKTCNSAETRRGTRWIQRWCYAPLLHKLILTNNHIQQEAVWYTWCILQETIPNFSNPPCRLKLLSVNRGKRVWCCCWKNILVFI